MLFEVIVQLKGSTLDDFNALITFETELMGVLGLTGDVEGHDVGTLASNVYVITHDPAQAFAKIKPVLARMELLETARVAHRPVHGEPFTLLWPENSTAGFTVG